MSGSYDPIAQIRAELRRAEADRATRRMIGLVTIGLVLFVALVLVVVR